MMVVVVRGPHSLSGTGGLGGFGLLFAQLLYGFGNATASKVIEIQVGHDLPLLGGGVHGAWEAKDESIGNVFRAVWVFV